MHHTELRARRHRLGLTQAQLAEYLGVATNTVARWERGEMRIAHPEMLRAMLKQLESASINELAQVLERRQESAP